MFTKDQLIERAQDNLLGLKNYVTVYPERAESEAMNIRLIEIALAALTTEPSAKKIPQRPVAFLNDAHLNRGHVDGGVTSDDDAPGMIPVYREPVDVVYVSCVPEYEFDELQERRKADSAEPIYQYRIRNGYNGQVTEWQTIRRDQVDFVLKAQPLNAEFRIISAPQPAPVVPETLPCPVHLEPGLKFGKGVRTQCLMDALRRRADYYAELEAMTPEQRAEHDAWIYDLKEMIGNGSRGDMINGDKS
ncbi:hypothetical protein [Citrobacter werkmanii]|uniref:hypothetical protein n=1 Tax=Citrobacter werkmanii TaxID=67827 RepID=UPI0034D6B816